MNWLLWCQTKTWNWPRSNWWNYAWWTRVFGNRCDSSQLYRWLAVRQSSQLCWIIPKFLRDFQSCLAFVRFNVNQSIGAKMRTCIDPNVLWTKMQNTKNIQAVICLLAPDSAIALVNFILFRMSDFSIDSWIFQFAFCFSLMTGYSYAMYTMKLALAHIVRNYRLTSPLKLSDLRIRLSVSFRMLNKTLVQVHRRAEWLARQLERHATRYFYKPRPNEFLHEKNGINFLIRKSNPLDALAWSHSWIIQFKFEISDFARGKIDNDICFAQSNGNRMITNEPFHDREVMKWFVCRNKHWNTLFPNYFFQLSLDIFPARKRMNEKFTVQQRSVYIALPT